MVLALIGWFAFVLVGGAALALATCPSMLRTPVLLVAVSPPLAAALAYGPALALNAMRIGPWPWVAIVQVVVVVIGATRAVLWWRSADPAPEVSRASEERRGRIAARWLLVAAVLTAAAIWLVPGAPSVPKNRDVQNHAYFVARISYENSVDASVVLAESPTVDEQVADFYPLAAHTQMAMAQRLTGAPTDDLLILWALLATVVTWPLGLFALARRLVPDRTAVAGWAALAGACTALFPYQPMAWGGIAMVVSLAAVPAVAALALEAVDRGRGAGARPGAPRHGGRVGRAVGRWAPIGLAAVAVAGVSFVHTSQAALLALLLGMFAVHDLLTDDDRVAMMWRWGTLAATSAVLLAPMALAVLAGATERSTHTETLSESAADVAWRIVAFDAGAGTTQVVMGLLALAGIAVMVLGRDRHPPARLWALLATFGALAALFASLTLTGALWDALRPATLPWYTSWWRMPYYLAALAPLFAALALSAAADSLARAFTPARLALPAPLMAVLLVAVSVPTISGALEDAGVRRELLTPAQRAMLAGLGEAVDGRGSDSVVLNQENDGTAWAYVSEEIPTFSALQGFGSSAGRERRRWLLENAEHLADDPGVASGFEQLGVGWVLVRDNTYENEPSLLHPDELLGSDGFELAGREGSLWLFEVDPSRGARTG